MKIKTSTYLLSVLLFWSLQSAAGPITCGSDQRTATLDSAEDCWTGKKNPKNATLQEYLQRDNPWQDVGHIDDGVTPADGTFENGFLSIAFVSGGFGSTSLDLYWSIADEFWDEFSEAVLTIHVGNGRDSPDHFAWLITPGATSGSLSYDRLTEGGGGGFSNIVLWGNGGPVSVPEPGTLALLGSGLLLLGLRRRRPVTRS